VLEFRSSRRYGRIDDRTTLRMLEELAERLGIQVRIEASWQGGSAAGGLCRIRGVPTVLIDGLSSTAERIAVLCEALSEFDLETVFLPPAIRARIRAARR
jgi:putative aminopeptidase FrvX